MANITGTSDAGWHLFRLPCFDAEYRRALDAITEQMRDAVVDGPRRQQAEATTSRESTTAEPSGDMD